MSDQVVSVRLRRGTTSTPWGFRMQGGFEHGSPLSISQVNPKSLSHRLGLRLGDRLLAIGPVQAHNMSHEQAKMEIIRAGNELDLIVQRSASAVIDQPDSRAMQRPPKVDPVEESTQYRGYTNPNVQSRSFKILQESLSYSEANEEGIVLPTGNTPGEGIVHRAYSEGRRRLEELSEINPRNFTTEGGSPYRVSEHYNTYDESIISQSQDPPKTVVAAKVYDGSEPMKRERPIVNIAQSSVLSPAAGQQQYLQQAKEHYQTKPEQQPQRTERPVVNIAQSSVLSPAAGQQQYLQQAREHYKSKSETGQQSTPEPVPQQAVTRRQRPKDRQLKLVNYQFDEQYGHLKKETYQVQQQGQNIQGNIQRAAVSPPKSGDFIPATEMVESVAADLHLKIVSPGAGPQQPFKSEQTSKQETQVVKPTEEVAKPSQQITRPPEPVVKSVEETVKPTEQISKPEQTVKPVEPVSKPNEVISKPVESGSVPMVDQSSEVTEEKGKAEQKQEISVVESQSSDQTGQIDLVTNDVVSKFAENMSSSVVVSAQQTVQDTIENQSTTSTEQAPVAVETESVKKVEEIIELPVAEPDNTTKPSETSEESIQVNSQESKSEQQQSNEQHVQAVEEARETIVVQQETMPEPEKTSETIPTTMAEEDNTTISVDVSGQTETVTTATDVKIPETQQATTEEVVEVNTQADSQQSTDINQTSEVEILASAEQNETVSEVQNVSIDTDVQSEEQSFSFSLAENETTDESSPENAALTFEVSANETEAAESSVSFEITTDAEVTLDISSDTTADVNADIANEVSVDSNTAATIAVQEGTSADAEVSVAVEENKSKTNSETPGKVAEPKQNGQNNSKPTKAKFLDSQGGVAARLARFKQK